MDCGRSVGESSHADTGVCLNSASFFNGLSTLKVLWLIQRDLLSVSQLRQDILKVFLRNNSSLLHDLTHSSFLSSLLTPYYCSVCLLFVRPGNVCPVLGH